MKIVNPRFLVFYILVLLCLPSCSDKNTVNKDIAKFRYTESNPLVFKLEILENKDGVAYEYFMDSKGKSTVLVTTKYGVDPVFFEGEEGVNEAVHYAEANNLHNQLIKRNSISILKCAQHLEEQWIMDEKVAVDYLGESNYVSIDSKLSVEEGWVRVAGVVKNCLKIVYTEKGFEGGFRMNMLNFVYEPDQTWKLVSKERVNTLYQDVNKEQMGYCIDTLMRHQKKVFEKGKQIVITNEMMFDLGDAICF